MPLALQQQHRPHHYYFAHHLIPTTFYYNPISFLQALTFEGKKGLLDDIWTLAAREENLPADMILKQDGLDSIEYCDFDNKLLGNIITMPSAQYQTEAIMICMLAKVYVDKNKQIKAQDQIVFTLEHGGDQYGLSHPYFCQWLKDRSHINLGRKNIQTTEEFLRVCKFNFRPAPLGIFDKLFKR